MKRNVLQKLFLALILPAIISSSLMAYDWDLVYPGYYQTRWEDTTLTDSIISARFDMDAMLITGSVGLNGDVYIKNDLGDGKEFYIDIGSGYTGGTPAFMFSDASGYGAGTTHNYGHMIFYASENSRIKVFIDNDLVFTGSNWSGNYLNNRDLTLTFSGPGQIEFSLADGRGIVFDGYFQDSTGPNADESNGKVWADYKTDYSTTSSGVKAYITMDQSCDAALDNGVNKVVFERRSYAHNVTPPAAGPADYNSVTTGTGDTCEILIGKNSYLTYISDVDTGLNASASGKGYGAIAFDSSCHGAGRLLLHTKGSYTVDSSGNISGIPFGYNDGALIVSGHYVPSYVTAENIRLNVQMNNPSGVEAIMRITDELAYQDSDYRAFTETGKYGPTVGGLPSRRGLLVLNECKSIPRLAGDTYVNNDWYNQVIVDVNGEAKNNRPGFILGINGHMDLFHNTFLDYVAGSTMMIDPYMKDREGNDIAKVNMKYHNPSALVVDGLGILNVNNFDPNNPYSIVLYNYCADAASYGGRHALVTLRGDSRIYARSGVMSYGYIPDEEGYWIGQDRVYSFTINDGSTDGTYNGSSINDLGYVTVSEGNHVVDLEGKATTRCLNDLNFVNANGFITDKLYSSNTPTGTFARHAVTGAGARGFITLPPIKIDYTGREMLDDSGAEIGRPLTVDTKYPCFNSSSFFMNKNLDLYNMRWEHTDVVKLVTPEVVSAEPSIVGGEKAKYDDYYWQNSLTGTANTLYTENPVERINTKVPLITMYDSGVYCSESLCASGVRFVITDRFQSILSDANGYALLTSATGKLMCYDHGDPLDMLKRGYGRTFMLGTQVNKMSGGGSLGEPLGNVFTQNAYIDIYRGWNTDGDLTTDTNAGVPVKLILDRGVQPTYIGQYTLPGQSGYSKLTDANLDPKQYKATEVFYLANGSHESLGWTTTMGDQVIRVQDIRDRTQTYTYGINEGSRPRPWDATWTGSNRPGVLGDIGGPYPNSEFKYSLTSDANDPGIMHMEGDHYYFGGRNSSGGLATEPVVASNESCVVYANHGGKITIADDIDCFVDTVFAYRPWPRILAANGNYIDGLSGLIDLPHDQVKFARAIQPYHLDFPTILKANDGQTKEPNVRLSVYDEKHYGSDPVQRTKASGEEVSIPWNMRTDKSDKIGHVETPPEFTPVKAFMLNGAKLPIRTTPSGSVVGVATMPEAVLTVSTGDIINQMRVSGATAADPFHLYVTGGPTGYGTVREFVSLDANYFNPGEGCDAAIFLDGGAHIQLGSREWNQYSNKAWNIIGYDYVTLYPNGNGVVSLNSNLIVGDRLPMIPTGNFGSYNSSTQVLTYDDRDQRITFRSTEPLEIRIPEGGELDLSAFGEPDNPIARTFPQQIEFAGNIRLVFEAGSRLRFPTIPTYQPVLYMNDNSRLIFEGTDDRDEEIWDDASESDAVRTKILGTGQIWLNKNARLEVFGPQTHVGIETDEDTPVTNVTISISRESGMFIGDPNLGGGAFQVGNPTGKAGHEISFTLRLNGPRATFSIDREGFVGFSVGVVNKFDDPNGNWRLQGMYNVQDINVNIIKGIFDHNQIFDGSSDSAGILGIGPVDNQYEFKLGAESEAVVKGGGNILYMYDQSMYPATKPPHGITIIGSTAEALVGSAADNGKYSILSSAPILRQFYTTFVGDAQSLFNYLRFAPLGTMPKGAYVTFGSTQLEERVGYVIGTAITRSNQFAISDSSNPETSLNVGALSVTLDSNKIPVSYTRAE